ncbi:hypothetical protein CPB83DRAFT_849373 [Crepidotus variabilis]|uniref:Uncharacterized protein n=1 Tax=Crepidotus variabilis TaxID=179855 RepID=A0A9P6ELM3_9AGAR|nr:hypothetical protein CPB83DRAFT_849373 [Crepidotus variabilis]
MEDNDPREQTLQALDKFIQTQRALLARQTSDIEHLERLKLDLVETPSLVLTNLSNEKQEHSAFWLSAQPDLRLSIPEGINWKTFEKADTTPLRTMLAKTKQKEAARHIPPTVQTSQLSELQLLVKKAKKSIVDPVLAKVARSPLFLLPDPAESEDEDPLEASRREEREKIFELKKRKVMVRGGGLSLRRPCNNVVFVRDDLVDESMDVDIGAVEVDKQIYDRSNSLGKTIWTTYPKDSSTTACVVTGRTRKPTVKLRLRAQDVDDDQKQAKKTSKQAKKDQVGLAQSISQPGPANERLDVEQDIHEVGGPSLADVQNSVEKRKSQTYKQAWSMEEQNLLEQLLEKIPEGEKNRWQKISKAMGGLRTPRQVASRVQKYFEKLKKYGVVA